MERELSNKVKKKGALFLIKENFNKKFNKERIQIKGIFNIVFKKYIIINKFILNNKKMQYLSVKSLRILYVYTNFPIDSHK
jgi:hypothetical protein